MCTTSSVSAGVDGGGLGHGVLGDEHVAGEYGRRPARTDFSMPLVIVNRVEFGCGSIRPQVPTWLDTARSWLRSDRSASLPWSAATRVPAAVLSGPEALEDAVLGRERHVLTAGGRGEQGATPGLCNARADPRPVPVLEAGERALRAGDATFDRRRGLTVWSAAGDLAGERRAPRSMSVTG